MLQLLQNAQEHNNNQPSLGDIGNLAYNNDRSATSDDSVNSLTTYNNHYTLLYPDLVQELFHFSLHNNNSLVDNSAFLRKIILNNTKSSSLDSSLSSSLSSLLSPRDILFFLQIVSLYQLELSKGNTSIAYPSLKLAKILGVDASCDSSNSSSASNMRATILKMTAKLESLGLLKVFRRKRKNGMDKANTLVPVLPDRLYSKIKKSSTNLKVSDSSKLDHESTLEHILRTKLFVPIELEFMKSLFKNNLPSKYKLFFLNCIMSAYRNFRYNSSSSNNKAEEDINSSFYDSQSNFIDLTNKLSFSATSSELMKKNNISRSTLDRIFRYVKQQGDGFFLKVEHKYTKYDDIDCNRYDKSIFVISINPLVFPISQITQSQKEEILSFNHDELQSENPSIFPDTDKGFKTAWSKNQPSIITKAALNNKDIIIKNKYSKNIDYIDVKSEEEFLENEQSSFPSKSYNNSSFLNDFRKQSLLSKKREDEESKTKSVKNEEQKEEWKELRNFYPISEKDISLMNSRANREFSNNFVNQLLLKLYIKYPEKRFKNRFTFLSYMAQILANEKHQGPLVNHATFRFSCNIGTEEKNLLEYERYLNQIEGSLDTSKEMCVKKKIAGRFSSEVAYKILTKVEFKLNPDNSFITALIPSSLALSERQTEILSQQLEAVYGINRYHVQEVEEENLPPNITTLDTGSHDSALDIPSNNFVVNTINENKVWQEIRKGLIEELGEVIDTVWFSKAVAKECTETNILTLTMPTRFMVDWVRNNYSHVIRRFAIGVGIKMVEYRY